MAALIPTALFGTPAAVLLLGLAYSYAARKAKRLLARPLTNV